MTWIWFALAGPAIWALCNHVDKFIISKYFTGKGVGSLVIFTGLSGFCISILIFIFKFSTIKISPIPAAIIAGNGALLVASYIPYLYALEKEEASVVSPLYQLIPVFGYFLGLVFLKEQLTFTQIIGSLLIIFGAMSISQDLTHKLKIKLKPLLLMALSSLMIALNGLIFKIIALEENFWGTAFWEYVGGVIFAGLLFAGIASYRRQFITSVTKNINVLWLNFFSEFLNVVAKLCANFASLLAPLALVWVLNGFQPVFVLLYGIILTLVVPNFYKETINRQILLQKIASIVVIFIGGYFLFK